MIREIQSVKSTRSFTILRHHVKAHQFDNEENISAILLPSYMNKTCDQMVEKSHFCERC